MGLTETIDTALVNRGRKGAARIGTAMLAFVFCIDMAVQVCLRQAPELVSASHVEWSAASLVEALSRFRDDTVDCLLAFIIRAILLIIFVVIAVRVGTPQLEDLIEQALDAHQP